MSRRARLLTLALLAILLVFYGSLVPLRLHDETGWAATVGRLGALRFEPTRFLWTGDFLVNVLIFLPVGFFATGSLAPRPGHRRVAAFLAGAAICACLAALVEFSQLFVRDRTASWSDVFALSTGGLAGSLLWAIVGATGANTVTSALRAARPGKRVLGLLVAYSMSWIAVGLLPLFFPQLAYPLPSSVWLRPISERAPSVAFASALCSALAVAPMGAGLAAIARWRWSGWRTGVLMVFGVAVVVSIDRIRQIAPTVLSPDAIARTLGLMAGAWFGWSRAGTAIVRDGLRPGRWPVVALAGWCGVLALQAWAPFDFGVHEHQLELRVRILYERVPLHRYYWAPPLTALHMALTVFLLAVPVGALLRLTHWRHGPSLSVSTVVLVATCLFAVLEWGQLYLPASRADPTDVIIAAAGALTGALLARSSLVSPPRPLADS